MAARLKVFQWSDGFHAFTVAASSRPKALAAWGIEQDIFVSGLAAEARHGPDADAARASPGQVIERRLEVSLPPEDVATFARRKPPAEADRKRVQKAEQAVDALDRAHEEAMETIESAMRDLRARREGERNIHEKARAKAVVQLDRARSKLGPGL